MSSYIAKRAAAAEAKCGKADRCKHGKRCPYDYEPRAGNLCFDKRGYNRVEDATKRSLHKIRGTDVLEDISGVLNSICASAERIPELERRSGVAREEIKRMHDGDYDDHIHDLIAVISASGYKLRLAPIQKKGGNST